MSFPWLSSLVLVGLFVSAPLVVGGCGRSAAEDPEAKLAPSSDLAPSPDLAPPPDLEPPRPVEAQTPAAPAPAPAAVPDLGGHKPGAHTDHAARNGGMLLMNGNLHFEVVFDPDGRHRVHFSDAVRAALPASVASEVTITIHRKGEAPELLALARADDGASWVSSGRALAFGAEDVARVAYARADAKPYWIDVPITRPAPKAAVPGAPPRKHQHKHGAHD